MPTVLASSFRVVMAGALAVVAVLAAAPAVTTLPLLYLAAATPALVDTDRAEHRLPNRLVLPGYAVAAVALAGQAALDGRVPVLPIVAGAGYLVLLVVPWLLGGMGFGDVKLAGVLGVGLGALGPDAALAGPLLAVLLGGVGATVALLRRRARGTRIPFGPSMLLGFWLAAALSLGA